MRQKNVLTSSKTEILNANNEVQQVKEETVTLTFDLSSITIFNK